MAKAKLKKEVYINSIPGPYLNLDAGDGELDPKEAAQLLAIQVNSLKQKLGIYSLNYHGHINHIHSPLTITS